MARLIIRDLKVAVNGQELLKGVNLQLEPGKLHVLIGPNGSGKSSLAQAMMGNPQYLVTEGKILMGRRDITRLSVDKRAKLGLFLAFQNPVEIPGVKMYQFLYQAASNRLKAHKSSQRRQSTMANFLDGVKRELETVGLPTSFWERDLNAGFSGGEKKRGEILQAAVLAPTLAILDEPDSGLDIDGQKVIAKKIASLVKKGTGVLLITHNPRILQFLQPQRVYVMVDGQIVQEGGRKLIKEVEKFGFSQFLGPKKLTQPVGFSQKH